MNPSSKTEVLICGAGAAGLTLGIDLARRGIAFRIVEKLSSPFAGSRGKGIKPRTQEIFEDLGVVDRVVATGGLYPPERDYKRDGTYLDTPVANSAPSAGEPYRLPLMVPQFLTEEVLRTRLAELGARVEFGVELISFRQEPDQVAVELRSGCGLETIQCDFLIGADGGRSFVRQSLEIGFPGKTLGVRAMVADVMVDGVSNDVWHRWGDGDMQHQIFLCPLRGTSMFQMQGPVPLEGDVDLSAEGLTKLLAVRSHRQDILVREVRWASTFHMNARLADRYRDGRILLCGDAAHVHPPTGGQGLNTSIQDAYNLGWKLGAVLRGGPATMLDTYEQERRPVAQDMLGLTTQLLEALRTRGDMRRGRDVQQLDLGYSESGLGLTLPARNSTGLVAGDRAPDACLTGRAGQSVRLFEIFKGPHWTLLGFQVANSAAIPARENLHIHRIGDNGDLNDDTKAFETTYGLETGDWVLVRPDGYIGAITDASHVTQLEAHLEHVGIKAPRG